MIIKYIKFKFNDDTNEFYKDIDKEYQFENKFNFDDKSFINFKNISCDLTVTPMSIQLDLLYKYSILSMPFTSKRTTSTYNDVGATKDSLFEVKVCFEDNICLVNIIGNKDEFIELFGVNYILNLLKKIIRDHPDRVEIVQQKESIKRKVANKRSWEEI
jgi:hypothetical protein